MTRTDAHHAWLFACAGFEVEHCESGCVNGEATAWVLSQMDSSCHAAIGRAPNEWRRPHRLGDACASADEDGSGEIAGELVQPTLDVQAMTTAAKERAAQLRQEPARGQEQEAPDSPAAAPVEASVEVS